jgi:DNA-binding NarL/FixJ family response regulator
MTSLVDRPGPAPAPRPLRFSAFIVVPDPALRLAVARQVRSLGALEITEAGSVDEARARARTVQGRDLCIIEAVLPDGSGIGLMTELRTAGWARGLLLSGSEDPYTVRAALAAGVRSFLVTASADSGPWPRTDPGLQHAAVRGRGGVRGPESLSAREVEVLRLVSGGKSNRDIGTSLELSALTVKSHLARIARKLGTGDRAEMVVLAMRAGLFT